MSARFPNAGMLPCKAGSAQPQETVTLRLADLVLGDGSRIRRPLILSSLSAESLHAVRTRPLRALS